MSMTMAERIARIIGEHYDGYADPIDTPNNWSRALNAAVAALEAMREPTPEMIGDGLHKPFFGESPRLSSEELVETWKAMIDRAILEQNQ